MKLAAHRRLSLSLVSAAVLFGAATAPAAAQVPTVDPDGTPAEPAEPPPEAAPPASRSPVIVVGPNGEVKAGAQEEEGPEGFYYSDDSSSLYPGLESGSSPGLGGGAALYPQPGPVPETHVVRRGDTLWDICYFYFNNPWDWPRVWSLNPQVTNPHWIYPGDQIRLRSGEEAPQADTGEAGDQPEQLHGLAPAADTPQESPRRRGWFSLRQLAFVDLDDLRYAARVAGSADEKLLLAEGDTVYLSYPEGRPPKVGERYAIFSEKKKVKHPETGKPVGAYVKVVGEVEIRGVKKGKRASGIITDSADVIERGDLVGPLQRTFKDVKPAPSEVDLQATIVAQLEADELIGARQVVFIDKGSESGLRKGNRMYVVRRGDAYETPGGRVSNKGLDDRRYPARAIGEVLVVQAGKRTSVGLVTLSMQEIEPGDLVLMRRSSDGE